MNNELGMLYRMILIRRFEEKCAELYSAGKIRGFLHLYIGEEAIAVGTIQELTQEDNIVATYREHGHALMRGISPGAIMLEMYGKQEGCSKGRGGSMHLFEASKKFFGGNAIVGGGIPLAVGLALSAKMQNKNGVTACYFGDGSTAEGIFHESMNMAVLWQLPVLFLCENNFYAMGTKLSEHQAQTDLSARGRSYNMEAVKVDGMDVIAVQNAMQIAVKYVRAGKGPYFIEFETYRFRAHSMYDADLYREKTEIEQWKKRDPITMLFKKLNSQGIASSDQLKQMEEEVDATIAQAIEEAERGTWERIENLTSDVYCTEMKS